MGFKVEPRCHTSPLPLRRVVSMVQRPAGALQPLPLMTLRPGQEPARQGQPSPGLWVVQSGVLRAAVLSAEGQEVVLDMLGAGDPVGEPTEQPSTCTVRAVRPSRLRAARPDEAAHLLSLRARRAHATMCELVWLDTQSRIHSRLMDLAARFGKPAPGGMAIPIRLTQSEIGLMTGVSRERVNRAIRQLEARGLVTAERRGRYVVRSQLTLVKL